MTSVEEALELIRQAIEPHGPMSVEIHEALGLQLAVSVVSDFDSPPFDKSMLDGYAIIADDQSPTRHVVEEVFAGGVPQLSIAAGETVLVMTGAPLPAGADAVIKHEDVTRLDDDTVQLPAAPIAAGSGIFRRGESFREGEQLLDRGKILRPIDVALLAEIGKAQVTVLPRPRVAVLATGNELVSAGEPLAPGQIRNSNGPMLLAALTEAVATPIDLGITRDDREQLLSAISQGLEADMLLITDGVSAGVLDLVPGVLAELGVEQIFHKVRMKPGKPIWFGKRVRDDHRTIVFGLPGNPVSTLVGFELFVKPALVALAGGPFEAAMPVRGQLTASASHRGERPTYHPCRITRGIQGVDAVEPLRWRGSADLAAFTSANGLMILPAGDYQLAVGTPVDALPL